MRIILHLGLEKTGTTALQKALHAASVALRARGVAYPRWRGPGTIAHHLLLPLCADPTLLPPWSLATLGGPLAAVETAWAAWNATCDAVLSDPPDVLFLSSELLALRTDAAAKARLAATLAELSDDILPVIYVRDPVAQYRAGLQEWLKTENAPLPPAALPLREAVLETEAAFGRPPALVAFDRATLHGGDITADVVQRFLAPRVGPADVPPRVANVGRSAEALVLMAQLRAEGGATPEAARRVHRLLRRIRALDRDDPPAQPLTLRPDVARAALRAATGHRWLAETGRLTIPGLDVTCIDGAPVPEDLLTAPPESLFDHDPARLARLRAALAPYFGAPPTKT